jgi:hypothetical protein
MIVAVVDDTRSGLRRAAIHESAEEHVINIADISCLPYCVLFLDPLRQLAADRDKSGQ